MRHKRTSAFTIVELLVVIAILTLLLAILLPALARARRAATRAACFSNLRQLAVAMTMYATDNGGWLPHPAMRPVTYFNDDPLVPQFEDWLYWQPGRDFAEGRIMKYIGANAGVLRCPADTEYSQREYPYSYTVNHYITGLRMQPPNQPAAWCRKPCKLSKVRKPSEKILMVEESGVSIYDGGWRPGLFVSGDWSRVYYLSRRHERSDEGSASWWDPSNLVGNGNVAFVDGHCGALPRERAHYGEHCGPDQ